MESYVSEAKRRVLGWEIAALALVILLVGVLGCGTSDSQSTAVSTADTTEDRQSSPTEAVLEPVASSRASGTVRFMKKNRIGLLHVELQGLKSLPDGGQYVLWLMASRHSMVPLATYPPGKGGTLSQTWQPNSGHLAAIEDGSKTRFMVTKTMSAPEKEKTLLGGDVPYYPPFIGDPILRGTFVGPLVGSASN